MRERTTLSRLVSTVLHPLLYEVVADAFGADVDLSDATVASLTRLLRDELVVMCESRGIEVGGTKPQLAKALLEWVSVEMYLQGCLLV